MRGKPTVVGICSGAVAGLVAITPASGFVGPGGALAIGAIAGISQQCILGSQHRPQASISHVRQNDVNAFGCDCFGVHGIGGAAGAILTGVFAIEQYGGTAGLIEGNAAQVLNQIEGVAIVVVYDAIVSLIILALINAVIGLRVPTDIEREGLDITLHGEAVQ